MKRLYKNVKFYITITTVIVIVFNFLYYRGYYNQQIKNHSINLARQSKLCGNTIEEKISDLRNDLKFYFTKEDFDILFDKNILQNESVKKIRQFFIKYNDLITEITINNDKGNYLQFTGNTDNYFSKKISKNYKSELIDNDSVIKYDLQYIYFVTPLKKEKNTLANILLKIDLKLFSEIFFKLFHINEHNFQTLLTKNGEIVYTNYKYNFDKYSEINLIKNHIDNNLESIIHQSIKYKNENNRIISSIYPIKIFGLKYGILFSEKKSVVYDIVFKKTGLISFFTIIFFLMIIFIFQLLIISLKKNELALVQRNKELEKITFSISHHLQEPLRKISIFSDMLKNKLKFDSNDNNLTFQKIVNLVDYMRIMLNSLLKYTEIARKKEIQFEKINLNEIIYGIKEKHDDNKNIEFKIHSLIDFYGEKQLINQLIEYIIDNSIKFAIENKKCKIEIYCKNGRKFIQLIVKDNGIGFEQQYENVVFEPFYKIGKNSNLNVGLGLTIAQKIVEFHKGNIKINSEINKGTEVIIEFKKNK